MRFFPCFFAVCVVCQTSGLAQTPVTIGAAPVRFVNPWTSVTQPNIPADPLEAVSSAEPVTEVMQRAAAVKLLNNAQFFSNVRRGPYDLKIQFTSPQGTWQVEDSSPGRNVYRWAVQGATYSAVNLFLDRVIYSNQPAGGIPLRVVQAHSAIFGSFPMYGPRATLRMANGSLNGTPVNCVLASHLFNAPAVSGPRRWEESESCVDPKSGLLLSYSPVPGMYIVFDYSNARHLRDIVFPGKFTISEAGQTVEAQVVSLTEPAQADAPIYTATGLNALGVGFPLTPPWNMQEVSFTGKPVSQAANGQFAVVRCMVSPDGSVTDAEVLASSDPALNQKALERATQPQRMMPQEGQNGVTPQAHEAFITILFVTN